MPSAPDASAPAAPFSERAFYLAEFRGRTLAIAVPGSELRRPAALEAVLKELEANDTRVVLICDAREALESLLGTGAISSGEVRLEAAIWRRLRESRRAGLAVEPPHSFAMACREVGLRLGVSKLVWIDPAGGLQREGGSRDSFIDLEQLRGLLHSVRNDEAPGRMAILCEIEAALADGLPAVNLCTLDGLAEELFTYGGSGTLFTRDHYVEVRRLGLDDFDAADDLIARGVAEGFLVPRSEDDVARILSHGFGAFVGGRHMAGIGALLVHATSEAGEIASLYTLTRFLREGIGGHLVGHALERAESLGCAYAFACTTSDPVVRFFERQGFRCVDPDAIPAEKWQAYDSERRKQVRCLRRDLF
jgi:amino-acid N-acetyltransferase